MSFLDFLFPKYCIGCKKMGSYLCSDCFVKISFAETGFCTICQKAAVGGLTHPICKRKLTIEGVFASLVYVGVVKKLVYQFKYKPYLTNLRGLLTDFLYEGLIQKEAFARVAQKGGILVPIPLHQSKMRIRGYNQAMLLAQGLGQKLDMPVLDCLERIVNTKTQVGLNQKERVENISGAFILKKEKQVLVQSVKQVFLVDDVVTTGATLREAAKILKKAGAEKVFGITLAHGE